MIGRAAEHAVGQIGDPPVTDHAPLQVVARARAQEIDRVPAAVLLVGHVVAARRIRLHVVERRDGLRGVAKRRMPRHVVDPLGADVDDASVAQGFEMFLSGSQHVGSSVP